MRIIYRRLVVATLLGLAATLCTPETNAQKLLQWRFEQGQSLDVWFTQDMTVQMTAMGQEMESSADMGMLMRWDIQQVNSDGSAEIKQSIERLSMRLETPGSDPIEYDSAQKEEAAGLALTLASSVEPMVGVEFMQKMSPSGEILEVSLSEAAQQKLATAPSGAQLKEVLSRDGLRALLTQAATVFPTTPIQPGDTWTGSTKSQSPIGQLLMEMKYTYRGTEVRSGQPLERIDVEMLVSFPGKANQNGVNIRVQNQRNTGALFFDAAAGRFVETELKQNMRMVTTMGDQQHSQLLSTVLRMSFSPVNPIVQATATRPAKADSLVQPASHISR